VITHVLPLLGNPRLAQFASVMTSWLGALSKDCDFRELLLEALVRRFPQTSRGPALVVMSMIMRTAITVPMRLVKRLLATIGMCLTVEDRDVNSFALMLFKSQVIATVLDSARVSEATPLLEALFVRCFKRPDESSPASEALVFISKRRRTLVREFGERFADRAANLRERWAEVAALAGVGAFDTSTWKGAPFAGLANRASSPVRVPRRQSAIAVENSLPPTVVQQSHGLAVATKPVSCVATIDHQTGKTFTRRPAIAHEHHKTFTRRRHDRA
jgi:hypothetical protein